MLTRTPFQMVWRGVLLGFCVAAGGFAGTAGAQTPAQQFLRITEIMYSPAGAPAINSDAQQFEYLELKNISSTTTLNLSNVRLSNGVTFNFSAGTITSLAPGAFVLVVRNQAAFTALYGPGLPIAGQYSGALNNSGEAVLLQDGVATVLDFDYSNLWHPATDGAGFSLVILNELAAPSTWGLAASWRQSSAVNGSPGRDDPLPNPPYPVRVNEVLSHPAGDGDDYIELVNLSATNVNIGGWFLTDNVENPKRYRIADNTLLPGNGYLVFSQSQFGAGANGFGFSEYGEGAYIFAADAAGALTGFNHGFEFGAAPRGVSFGRYVNSQGEEHFVLQSALTGWTANAAPLVGPVIFSEVMYNPPGALEEYIELENITDNPVPLYCTDIDVPGYGVSALTNTWRLRNGVEFDFPQGVVLPAHGVLLVVGFDPATNATQVAAVRAQYGIPDNVPIYGPYDGKLSNSGDTIHLLGPGDPDVAGTVITVPYILWDKLTYMDTAPWPAGADGDGASLQRRFRQTYGNDPTNWVAATPAPGRPVPISPPTIQHVAMTGSTLTLTIASIAGFAYTLEYRDALSSGSWTALGQAVVATGSTLLLTDTNPPAGPRFYRVRTQ